MKIEELVEYVWDVYAKMQQKNNVDLKLCIKSESDMLVLCDEQLLKYLFHVLMTMSFEDERCGCITLSFDKSDGFVNFAFTDDRGHYEAEKLNSMFYPDALSTADDAEARKVMQILVCKQIIREHDDHIGQRGCRMYACPNEPYGYQLVFKLPI
jgi:light-regulated signal transduction histidine kinase (bacteriophytochrome)